MEALTLYTQNERQALEHFLTALSAPNLQVKYNRHTALYEALCPREIIDPAALTRLLEQVVILRHPIYGYSSKLTDLALDLQQTKIHQANIQALKRYLYENNSLHIEGYAAFRMAEYAGKLDMMMYGIIKKMRQSGALQH